MKVDLGEINYPMLDEMENSEQKVYLFMLLQKDKEINLNAIASILHLDSLEVRLCFMNILNKINPIEYGKWDKKNKKRLAKKYVKVQNICKDGCGVKRVWGNPC